MKALVKAEPGPGMVLEERPTPEPGPEDVRVAVESVGIDGGVEALVYEWHSGWHHLESALPQVFGHEFAGVVDAVGEAVDGWSPGDTVAVEPAVSCGQCDPCRTGEPNYCLDMEGVGFDTDGALAEYVITPASTLRSLGGLSFDAGAYLEVLGVGVNGVEYSTFEPGDSVAIAGPGPVGIGVLATVVAGGADTIAMLGTDADTDTRLSVADQLGATEIVNVEEESFDGLVDVFFECSGAPDALETAINTTKRGGQIVQVGIFHGESAVSANLNGLVVKGIDYRPTYGRRPSSWRRARSIARQTDLASVLGPSFPLDDFEAAFRAEREREGIKVLLHP